MERPSTVYGCPKEIQGPSPKATASGSLSLLRIQRNLLSDSRALSTDITQIEYRDSINNSVLCVILRECRFKSPEHKRIARYIFRRVPEGSKLANIGKRPLDAAHPTPDAKRAALHDPKTSPQADSAVVQKLRQSNDVGRSTALCIWDLPL